MKYFIGQYPLNYAPVANEKILVGFQQYAERNFKSELDPESGECGFLADSVAYRKPHDRIAHVFYPYHSTDSDLLDKCGIGEAVYDADEKFGHDLYNEVGYAKLASARYVDGYGFYEVESHKSFNKLRTTTWVPQPTGVHAVIRKIEVGSLKKTAVQMEVYPQLHVKGELYEKDGILISKQVKWENDNPEELFMAIGCKQATGYTCGVWKRGAEASAKPEVVDTKKERPNLTLHVKVNVPARQWAEPVYLILGLGHSEGEALANLQTVQDDADHCYGSTRQWWEAWHKQGLELTTENKELNDILRVAKTIMRMSFDPNGLTSYIGYHWYQGAVWIRDNSWITMCLSRLGYADDAYRILTGLKSIVKKRKDGSFNFIYGSRNYPVCDFSWESDSMGLILTAAGYWWDASHNKRKATAIWDWLAYCAEWICTNIDEAGLVVPDAGIWEDFTEEKGLKREHMIWTSLISAWGVKKAGEIAAALGKDDLAKKYNDAFEKIRSNIVGRCIKDNVLVRSPEAEGRNLDSSVLYVWTWTPMVSTDHPALAGTMAAMEDRIKDPVVGGFWRHENANNDLGDTMPWVSATMWAGECYLHLGEAAKAQECLQWTIDVASQCAGLPECMFNPTVPHVMGMSSLSSIGIWGFMETAIRDKEMIKMLKPVTGKIAGIPRGYGSKK